MFRSGSARGFLAGFLLASVLFGGAAMAADIIQKDIRVSYLPLKFMYDGAEKAPPADQQGFTYNGRTYVPLRFAAESLGKKVDYDPTTFTIYLGRRPAPLPEAWQNYKPEGPASIKVAYYPTGLENVAGVEMPNSLLVSALAPKPEGPAMADIPSVVSTEIALSGKYDTMTGTLFVPEDYLGHAEERQIAKLMIMNEYNKVIYETPVMTSRTAAIPFTVNVNGLPKARIVISLYHNQGFAIDPTLVATHIGIGDLQLK